MSLTRLADEGFFFRLPFSIYPSRMHTKHARSATFAAAECPDEVLAIPPVSAHRPAGRGFLLLAICLSVAVPIGCNRPPAQDSHVSRLADQALASPSPPTHQPVIPLEALFPPGSADGQQDVGHNKDQTVTASSSGSNSPSPDPIPATASDVVSETRKAAEELAARFPDQPDAMEITARMYLWLGDAEAAGKLWEQCLALDPNYAYAHDGLGILASKRGSPEEAISRYRKALEVFGDAPSGLGTRIRLATVLVDQGRLDEAIELLKRDAQASPAPIEALFLLGMAHLQARNYAEARRNYQAVIARHPMHANAHFGLATACKRLGDSEAAARHMKQFEELRAGERAIRVDQRSHYDDVEEMRVELAGMHSNAGRLCHSRGDLVQAERHWRRAALLDPHAVECRQAVAWFCQQDGRLGDAVSFLRQLAEIEPDNPAYLLEVGRLETLQGKWEDAEKDLQTVLDKQPQCADGHASLARLYLRAGRNPERIAELAASAARLEPTTENLLLLAAASERNGDLSAAVAAMERVATLAPGRADCQQMLRQLQNRLAAKNAP